MGPPPVVAEPWVYTASAVHATSPKRRHPAQEDAASLGTSSAIPKWRAPCRGHGGSAQLDLRRDGSLHPTLERPAARAIAWRSLLCVRRLASRDRIGDEGMTRRGIRRASAPRRKEQRRHPRGASARPVSDITDSRRVGAAYSVPPGVASCSAPLPAFRTARSSGSVRDSCLPFVPTSGAQPPELAVGRCSDRVRVDVAVAGRVQLGGEVRSPDGQRSLRCDTALARGSAGERADRAAASALRPVGDRRLPLVAARPAAPPQLPVRGERNGLRIYGTVSRRVQLAGEVRAQSRE